MGNEGLYLQATGEIDENRQNPAIWAKARALTEGDIKRARYKYIQLRVEQLETSDLRINGDANAAKNSSEKADSFNNDLQRSSESAVVDQTATEKKRGFVWWQVWGWLGLTLGNVSVFVYLPNAPGLALILAGINTILMLLVILFNKHAFLIGTILSFNPLLWIINGIYLKNRWNHPQVNSATRNDWIDRPATDRASQTQSLPPTVTGDHWICVCGHANPFHKDMEIQNCVECHRNRDFVLQGGATE